MQINQGTRRMRPIGWTVFLLVLLVGVRPTGAATPGLPFTEDFADTNLRDAGRTVANWSTEEQALMLAWRYRRRGAFGSTTVGSDITAEAQKTKSVALGDVDGDGDLDLVVGNEGESNRLYLNNGTADPFDGVTGKDITQDVHWTHSVALGDVDADGDLDLVAGNSEGQVNRLYLNNGTSDPFDGVTGSDITADLGWAFSIALGDVDADGDLDLVAGNWSFKTNRLYLNNGTADPFDGVAGRDITADAQQTTSVALADVDADGDLDLVAANDVDMNRLYLNNGTADPFNGVTGSDITSDAHRTASVALGDVDADGDLDLVAGNFGQASRLYPNNGTADPFDGVTGSDITADADQTLSLALGDVDADGDLDLVTGNQFQANVLYRNNGTTDPFDGVTGSDITADAHDTWLVQLRDLDADGDLDLVAGNLAEANRLYLNEGTANPFDGVRGADISGDMHRTESVALGDVDADGDLDVVAGNWTGDANRLYLNNGTADPFDGVTGSDITADTLDTRSLAFGDVDRDGDLDLVAGNAGEANRLYLNNGTADPFDGVAGSDITADVHETWSVALGDVDRDGDLDLVAGNAGEANRLYLNNGTADPFDSVTGSDITTDAHSTWWVALGDVDADGDLDLATGCSGQANRLYLNNGTADPFAGVTGSDITADAHDTRSVTLGDVDRDGDLDLVAGNSGAVNRLYLNNGTVDPFDGAAGSDITADTNWTYRVALGDVDADGDLDLVAGNDAEINRLYLNNGTADPFDGVTGSDITTDSLGAFSIALGDVDRDGDLDLVAGNSSRLRTNRLYLNDSPAAPFGRASGSDITADTQYTSSVALGDVDRDGDLDLVAGSDGGKSRLYLNNATAAPFEGVTGSDITADEQFTFAVALGDVDADGDLDLVTGNVDGRNRLYLNNGTAAPFDGVTGSDITADAHSTEAIALGDLDADGDLDLVAGNYHSEVNRLYLNNGTAAPFDGVTGSDITADEHNTASVALGDLDRDGDLDLVAGNDVSSNRLYLNNGTADPFSGVAGSDITMDQHNTASVALGDMDRDGDLDLVAGDRIGANRLYLNNGTSDPFGGVTGSGIGTDAHETHSVGLGDVDQDGDLDLVAGNFGAENRLYLNNGTSDPFDGVSGADITADAHATHAVALGDVDRDGDLDLVAGNADADAANRLYRRAWYDAGGSRAVSLEVDTETADITGALLMVSQSSPPNTGVDYWLSNDGGSRWYIVSPGRSLLFPTPGSDLRWKAELWSLSGLFTPRVDELSLDGCLSGSLPGSPGNGLRASKLGLAAVRLDWTATTGASVYPVLRCDAVSGPCTPALLSTATDLFFEDAAPRGNPVWYRIQASNACGTTP